MKRFALLFLFPLLALAQTTPTPLQVTRVYGVTSATQVQDNRSVTRQCNYNSFSATGTGTWTVQMEYSDAFATGPWTPFGTTATVTNTSASSIGYANGYHNWIRFNVTVGAASIIYSCSKDYFLPPGTSASGGGGTGGTFTSPYPGAVQRTTTSKENDIVSVQDFGADPTGIVDSYLAFQNTLNAATIRKGVGVRIPCGTYTLSGTLVTTTAGISVLGESSSCVHLIETGTNGFFQNMGNYGGEVGNFSFTLPNAVSPTTTFGIWTNSQNAYYHDIQVDSCTNATAFKIDNGTVTNGTPPNNVGYVQGNVWSNVRENYCAIGWRLGKAGVSPPDYLFMGYNHFVSLFAAVQTNQTAFQLDAGPLFHNSDLNLQCGMASTGAGGDFNCVKSTGFWDHNLAYLNGEWNGGGGVSGTPYSVNVQPGGSFVNVGGNVNIRQLQSAGVFGNPIGFLNSNGASGAASFTMKQQDQPSWDTGSFNLGTIGSGVPWTGFRDQGVGQFGLLEGTNIQSPFATMLNVTGNKFVFGKVAAGSPVGSMTEVANVDTTGNINLQGGAQATGFSSQKPTAYGPANTNEDLPIGTSGFVILSGGTVSGAYSIGGFTGGVDGRVLTILNLTGQQLTLNNLDTGSAAVDRITTLTGANLTLRSGNSAATFRYAASSNTWLLVSGNGVDSGGAPGSNGVVYQASDPSGACAVTYLIYSNASGNVFGCQSGLWVGLPTGGGSITVPGGTGVLGVSGGTLTLATPDVSYQSAFTHTSKTAGLTAEAACPVSGSATTDNTTALQNAINSISSAGGGTLQIAAPAAGYCYEIKGQITVPRNVKLIGQDGESTVLRFTLENIATHVGLVAGDTGSTNLTPGGMQNISIWGPKMTATFKGGAPSGTPSDSIGMYWGGDPAGTIVSSSNQLNFFKMDHVEIKGFNVGIQLGSNAYIIDNYSVDLRSNKIPFFAPNAVQGVNSGEHITFIGGTWGDNGQGAVLDSNSAEMYFAGTSFDYNQNTTASAAAFTGRNINVVMHGGHMEDFWGPFVKSTGGTSTTGDFVRLELDGVNVFATSSSTAPAGYTSMFDVEPGGPNRIQVKNSYFQSNTAVPVIVKALSSSGDATASFLQMSGISGFNSSGNIADIFNRSTINVRWTSNGIGLPSLNGNAYNTSSYDAFVVAAAPVTNVATDMKMTTPAGVNLWTLSTNGAAAGSNAGQDLTFGSYADSTGSFLQNSLVLKRSNGRVQIQNAGMSIPNNVAIRFLDSTGAEQSGILESATDDTIMKVGKAGTSGGSSVGFESDSFAWLLRCLDGGHCLVGTGTDDGTSNNLQVTGGLHADTVKIGAGQALSGTIGTSAAVLTSTGAALNHIYAADAAGTAIDTGIDYTTLSSGGGGGGAPGTTPVNLSGQTAAISPTSFFSVAASGNYIVCSYSNVTTAATTGTLFVDLTWNDGVSTNTTPLNTYSMTAKNQSQSCNVFYAVAASTLQYSTILDTVTGSPVYGVVISLVPINISTAGYQSTLVLNIKDYASLSAAVTAIGSSTQTTLAIPAGSYNVAASLTVPKNITLWFLGGGTLSVASGQTLTVVGPVRAGDTQIFAGAGLVSFAANAIIDTVSAKWWGATGDGTTDDTANLQKALVASTTAANRLAFHFTPDVYRVCNLFLGNSAGAGCPSSGECPAPARVYSDGGVSVLHAKLQATNSCGGTAGDYVVKANSTSSFTFEDMAINGNATSTPGTGASCMDVSWKYVSAPAQKSNYQNLDIQNCKDATGNYAINADQDNDATFRNISITGASHTGNMVALSILAGGGQAGPIDGLKIYNSAGYVQMDVQNGQISNSYLTGGLVLGFSGSVGGTSRNLITCTNCQIGQNAATGIVINGLKTTGSGSSIESFVCSSCVLAANGDLTSGQAIFGGYWTAGAQINGGDTHVGTGAYLAAGFASGSGSKPAFFYNGTYLNGSSLPVSNSVVSVCFNGAFDAVTTGTVLNTCSGGGVASLPFWNVITDGGAKGDGKSSTNGSITSGLAVLTHTGAIWSASDVGKLIVVGGAGVAGADLVTTIASFSSSTSITLTATAGTTKSANAFMYWGTNDAPAINALINAHLNSRIYYPTGNYVLDNRAGASGISISGFNGDMDFQNDAHLIGIAANATSGWVVNLQNGSGYRLHNIWVSFADEAILPQARGNSSNGAIQLAGATHVVVDIAHVNTSAGLGLIAIEGTDIKMFGVEVLNSTADGCSFINTQDGMIDGLYTNNTGDDGLSIINYTFDTTTKVGFVGSNITVIGSHTRGISVPGQSYVNISNFKIVSSASDGIVILRDTVASTSKPHNIAFTNGSILNAGNDGIDYYDADFINFSNINIQNSTANGFSSGVVAATNVNAQGITIQNTTTGAAVFTSFVTKANLSNFQVDGAAFACFYTSISSDIHYNDMTCNDVAKSDSNHYMTGIENNVGPVDVNGAHFSDDNVSAATGYILEDFSNGTNQITFIDYTTNFLHGTLGYNSTSTNISYQPLSRNFSNTVTFSATPVFDLSRGIQAITLTGNVSSSTVTGSLKNLGTTIWHICQDSTGGRTFAWPTGFKGVPVISTANGNANPSTCNVVTMDTLDGTNFYATGLVVVNQ